MSAQQRALRLRAAAIAAVVLAVLVGCIALYRAPIFAVSRVEVVGATHVSKARIVRVAKVPPDATLIRFPADEVAERVAAEPWVASVSVSRVFPDAMRIRVVERVAVAVVDAGQTMWIIDRTGWVIGQPSVEDSASLPVVRDVPGLDPKAGRRTTSEPLLNALAVLAGLPADLRSGVRAVSAPSIDGTTLYTADRVELVMGSDERLADKVALVRRILAEQRGRVVSIDVRTVDRPTWRGLK